MSTDVHIIPRATVARLASALPFWLSLAMVPVAWISASFGGWTLLLLPVVTWYLFAVIDFFAGLNTDNADLETPEEDLFWYRLITLIWAPIQALMVFGILAFVTAGDHLTRLEEWLLFVVLGIVTGAIGIVYAHELMHQRNRLERWMGDLLMTMVLYGHFRSEHLLVHHRYVGTPKDPVTARYNEGFYHYFVRVLPACLKSSFRAEQGMLARKDRPWTDLSNPFWRYGALQLGFLLLAVAIGGLWGLFLFVTQAFVAVAHLELTNYIEHYGLTRKHLGGGKYEHVKPRHSWNAAHRASNWLLINLQRHSDHHYKPDRRFPLLQNYDAEEAPQLPMGYPGMGIVALIPPVWFRRMNPRVRAWRKKYYPEIEDWGPYKAASNPMPR